MGRHSTGDSMPWHSTDKNIITATSLMAETNAMGDHHISVTRDNWYDSFGRYFIRRTLGKILCFRDWAPDCGFCSPYVVNWDWKPSDDDKKATNWRKYI